MMEQSGRVPEGHEKSRTAGRNTPNVGWIRPTVADDVEHAASEQTPTKYAITLKPQVPTSDLRTCPCPKRMRTVRRPSGILTCGICISIVSCLTCETDQAIRQDGRDWPRLLADRGLAGCGMQWWHFVKVKGTQCSYVVNNQPTTRTGTTPTLRPVRLEYVYAYRTSPVAIGHVAPT